MMDKLFDELVRIFIQGVCVDLVLIAYKIFKLVREGYES